MQDSSHDRAGDPAWDGKKLNHRDTEDTEEAEKSFFFF